MALLFLHDTILKDLGVCNSSLTKDNFCFDTAKSASQTKKLQDLFFDATYGFTLSPGAQQIMGSGGCVTRFKESAVMWKLGTPRIVTEEEIQPGEILLGGTGPEYMLKCEKTDADSSCMFWKKSEKYPDPLPAPPDHYSHEDWFQELGFAYWHGEGHSRVPESTQFAPPDADSIYELKHSPCEERIYRNDPASQRTEIVERSTECENFPLFQKMLDGQSVKPAPTPSNPSPTPPPPPAPTNADIPYLQVGVGLTTAMACGYKTYQEARKYFQKTESSQEFSTKRFAGYATATAASLAYTAYALRA